VISFAQLGRHGSLGNQLFQYAFLRTMARRLGVQFYCPHWIGDDVFLLEDKAERAKEQVGIRFTYREQKYFGLDETTLEIEDNTDIAGYFQTEKYFDRAEVRKWYAFKEKAILRMNQKYSHIDFSESVGVHLRFTDKVMDPLFYIPAGEYYREALSLVRHKTNVLVFSDDDEAARSRLRRVRGNLTYIIGNRPYEDLYLMTRCHDFVSSTSTLSWWGAWLNQNDDERVLCPEEGPFRPGSPVKNNDYWPERWIKLRTLKRGIWDSYFLARVRFEVARSAQRMFHLRYRRAEEAPRAIRRIIGILA
jgi:hypothetical protein